MESPRHKATPAQIAWAAGLFEGEGSIELSRDPRRKAPTVRLTITNADTQVLEYFAEVVGGCGHLYGPYGVRRPGQRGLHSKYLIARRREVHRLIALFWPWLSDRRKEQIRLKLEAHGKPAT